MQTSLKRLGFKFSTRKDMSAKFPRGGGGEQTHSQPSVYCLLQFQTVVLTSFCVEVKGNVFLQDGSAIIKTTVMIIKKNNLCCVKVSCSYVHDLLHDTIGQLSKLFCIKLLFFHYLSI